MRALGRRGIEAGTAAAQRHRHALHETFGSEAQKRRWLPRLATEAHFGHRRPNRARAPICYRRRDAHGGRLSSTAPRPSLPTAKTLISLSSPRKTDPSLGAKGISLLVVETDGADGFSRSQLDKIGRDMADTSELFFNSVFVPTENLLAARRARVLSIDGKLLQERHVMPQCMAAIEYALSVTIDYAAAQGLGKALLEFQNTQSAGACEDGSHHRPGVVDHCSRLLLNGQLDSATA